MTQNLLIVGKYETSKARSLQSRPLIPEPEEKEEDDDMPELVDIEPVVREATVCLVMCLFLTLRCN